ncbi:hypothetical protein KAW65_07365 [candidate division WOR-3 bacterium]|nr:hypothetical protein [candidate division WOR-3 bacterium]
MLIFLSTAVYGVEELKPLDFPPEIVLEPKSHKKAIALSLLVPGLGEQYMGNKKDAIRAYLIEGSIWFTYFGFRWYAGVLKNDYMLYAHANSGAKMGEGGDYYDTVEWYESLDDYNEYIRQEAREIYPKDKYPEDARERQLKYIEENSMPESLKWDWSISNGKWKGYRNLRKEKREVLQRASYCVGAAILNRLISAIIASHEPPRYGLIIKPNGFKVFFTLK